MTYAVFYIKDIDIGKYVYINNLFKDKSIVFIKKDILIDNRFKISACLLKTDDIV